VRMMGSVKARLTEEGSVPVILEIGEIHGGVRQVANDYVVPLYRERFYKYSDLRGEARIIEDTWICLFLVPYIPEQRAADPAHKERWDEVVNRFKPVILELTDPQESFLRNRMNLLAGGKEEQDKAEAKDVLTKLPALEKLAEELRAADKAPAPAAPVPAPPAAPGNF
jgi:hypothetical protein